jgi:hypothetical protein
MLRAKRRCAVFSSGQASGQGQYGIETNDIVSRAGTDVVVPKFGPHEADIVIRHSEYVRDIFVQGSNVVPFVVQTLQLNPGLPQAFPWLSQLAANYEEYSLVQCIYTFKSTIQQVAVENGQQGQILIATQYKPTDTPFADKESMMMYAHSTSGPLSSHVLHGVECDPAKLTNTTGVKYLRAGEVTGMDLKEYDHGILNIAISNPPVKYLGQSCGELWVSYTVVLRKPKLGSLNGNTLPSDIFYNIESSGAAVNSLAMNVPLPVANWWRCARNSFGCEVSNTAFTLSPIAQPASTLVNGVPLPGSLLDPLKVLTYDMLPDVSTDVYTSPTAMTSLLASPGGALGPVYVMYCLTLPDNFQGVCEVLYLTHQGAQDSACGFFSAGNIYPFRDMIEGNGTGGTQYRHFWRSQSTTFYQPNNSDETTGVKICAHIRVLPSTNGVRNRIYFYTLNTTATWHLYHSFKVHVYNATLSQSLRGTADRLELVNVRTGLPYQAL